MRVISTTDLSHEVNGTYVYKSVSLFEEFGMYNILTVEKTVGYVNDRKMYLKSNITSDIDEAKFMYKQVCGILED